MRKNSRVMGQDDEHWLIMKLGDMEERGKYADDLNDDGIDVDDDDINFLFDDLKL